MSDAASQVKDVLVTVKGKRFYEMLDKNTAIAWRESFKDAGRFAYEDEQVRLMIDIDRIRNDAHGIKSIDLYRMHKRFKAAPQLFIKCGDHAINPYVAWFRTFLMSYFDNAVQHGTFSHITTLNVVIGWDLFEASCTFLPPSNLKYRVIIDGFYKAMSSALPSLKNLTLVRKHIKPNRTSMEEQHLECTECIVNSGVEDYQRLSCLNLESMVLTANTDDRILHELRHLTTLNTLLVRIEEDYLQDPVLLPDTLEVVSSCMVDVPWFMYTSSFPSVRSILGAAWTEIQGASVSYIGRLAWWIKPIPILYNVLDTASRYILEHVSYEDITNISDRLPNLKSVLGFSFCVSGVSEKDTCTIKEWIRRYPYTCPIVLHIDRIPRNVLLDTARVVNIIINDYEKVNEKLSTAANIVPNATHVSVPYFHGVDYDVYREFLKALHMLEVVIFRGSRLHVPKIRCLIQYLTRELGKDAFHIFCDDTDALQEDAYIFLFKDGTRAMEH